MEGIVVWLISTAILWVVVNVLTNATEAFVHNYTVRVVAMICAGAVAGAAASAIGYVFFFLALLLFAKLMWLKRKLAKTVGIDNRTAWHYTVPSVLLLVTATISSYVFSLEVCEGVSNCHRVFFDRIYTPPHLIPPASL
jgi:galactitol-specific phosphotransferase system IIC component